ncbi:paraquat-inducible membrane protein A [Oceanimonas baumannii]|uniref:Paraquat-inducible membrane protein A n=1 Tax=Oceanimonas baumannii TaxID=129578 RepID=A0A235C9F8_9GAMM|nr:paraquat-inducible membrane protein A [Oceanimonas baumannii]TDW55286.1 paraquat-inducible protein A [Oceanimonas baumannii]
MDLTQTHPPHTTVHQRRSVSRRRFRVCHECDLVVALPALAAGQKADCPRCGHTLVRRHANPAERSLALALATLIALTLSVVFPFIGFELSGIGNRIELTDSASTLIGLHQPLVAMCVLLTVIILPLIYLLSISWLCLGMLLGHPLPRSRQIARTLRHVTPWMMADVFVIGTLVSLIKIVGMAEIELGLSFWTFCAFAMLLLLTTQSVDKDWLWFSLDRRAMAPAGTQAGRSASEQNLCGCATCGLVNALSGKHKPRCRRCYEPLHPWHGINNQATLALLAAALIMYLPANLYPIMVTTSLGNSTPSTIMGGVLLFLQHGDWPIAFIIFMASVVVPVSKILALLWLCYVVKQDRSGLSRINRIRLYRVTEFVGRWSMVDVFVVAILVALIRHGNLMSIEPGPASLAFAAVVVLTMLAAMLFDQRSIWAGTRAAPSPQEQKNYDNAKESNHV